MKLFHLWGRNSLPDAIVTSDEKRELERAKEVANRQGEEARTLLTEAQKTGTVHRLSRDRNHYGLIIRDLYRGESI